MKICLDYDLIYKILLVVLSIIGMFKPAAFSLTLILIIWENSTMKTVLKSVGLQLNKMFITLVLFFIAAYWYSIWAFMNDGIRGNYAFEDKMNCDTLLNCFRVHIDYGFANPPIWGEENELTPIPWQYEIGNFGYVLFINLIITAIISGIIIDTFADMRGQ